MELAMAKRSDITNSPTAEEAWRRTKIASPTSPPDQPQSDDMLLREILAQFDEPLKAMEAHLADAEQIAKTKRLLDEVSVARTKAVQYHKDWLKPPNSLWTLDQTIGLGCRLDPEWAQSENSPHMRWRIIERVAEGLLLQLRNGKVKARSNGRELGALVWSNRVIALRQPGAPIWSDHVIADDGNGRWGVWTKGAPRTGASDISNVRIKRRDAWRIYSVPKVSQAELVRFVQKTAGRRVRKADVLAGAVEHFVGEAVTEHYFNLAWNKLDNAKKRRRGETNKTITKRISREAR